MNMPILYEKTFTCNAMGDYHDSYLQTAVLILANVFENFRKTSMYYYNLDPSHYFSSPGFAWDAMLKITGASFELITDIDTNHNGRKRSTRRCELYCLQILKKNNNKYLNDYVKDEESSYLIYLLIMYTVWQ